MKDIHICNMCGESCDLFEKNDEPNSSISGLINAKVHGGYDSSAGNGYGALSDGLTYEFSLCEFCLDHMFKNFKHSPKISSYLGGNDDKYFSSETRVITNVIYRNQISIHFFQETIKRNKARKNNNKEAKPTNEFIIIRNNLHAINMYISSCNSRDGISTLKKRKEIEDLITDSLSLLDKCPKEEQEYFCCHYIRNKYEDLPKKSKCVKDDSEYVDFIKDYKHIKEYIHNTNYNDLDKYAKAVVIKKANDLREKVKTYSSTCKPHIDNMMKNISHIR